MKNLIVKKIEAYQIDQKLKSLANELAAVYTQLPVLVLCICKSRHICNKYSSPPSSNMYVVTLVTSRKCQQQTIAAFINPFCFFHF